MRFSPVLRITGALLLLFSTAQLVPVAVALFYNESTIPAFLTAFAITAGTGAVLWFASGDRRDLRSRDGFLITGLFYIALGAIGPRPCFSRMSRSRSRTRCSNRFPASQPPAPRCSPVLDDLPRSVLFYRQLLQWLGGMGIIVLAVAVLPMLGVGGMQIYAPSRRAPSRTPT